MKLPIWYLPLLLLVSTACVNREAQVQARKTEEFLSDLTVPVTVAEVVTAQLEEHLDVTGDVSTSFDAMVGAKVGGRITAVYVKEGDSVRAGQLIATLDRESAQAALRQAQANVTAARAALSQARANATISPDRSSSTIQSAEAQLRMARANLQKLEAGAQEEERRQAAVGVRRAQNDLDLAQKERDRVRSLFEQDAVSRQRLEQTENLYQSARAALDAAVEQQRMVERPARAEDLAAAREAVRQAEEGVRQARTAQRLDVLLDDQVRAAEAGLEAAIAQADLARQQVRDADVTSPFSGRISGRPLAVGTVVAPGTPIARVVATDGTYFEAQVPETQVARLELGMAVDVSVDALGDLRFSGTIAAINPLGRELGRLYGVRVQVLGLTEELKPGMFVRGRVRLREIPDAVVVPREAIVVRGEEIFVFVVDGDEARRVDVIKGLNANGQVQVSGLRPGQKVIVRGNNGLADGMKIRIDGEGVDRS